MAAGTASSTTGSSTWRRSVPTLMTHVRSPRRRTVSSTSDVAVNGSDTVACSCDARGARCAPTRLTSGCSTLSRRDRKGARCSRWRAALLGAAAGRRRRGRRLPSRPQAGVRLGNTTARRPAGSRSTARRSPAAPSARGPAHPVHRRWRRAADGRTGADGRFAFSPAARPQPPGPRAAAASAATAPTCRRARRGQPRPRSAYVLPAFTLELRAARRAPASASARSTPCPRDVRLTRADALLRRAVQAEQRGAAPRSARRSPARAACAPGRYVARATVRIPASLRRPLPLRELLRLLAGSGMGNPPRAARAASRGLGELRGRRRPAARGPSRPASRPGRP